MTRRSVFPQIAPAQLAALRAYRDLHGERWKERLEGAWNDPSDETLVNEFALLRPMRSWYGPRWLAGFKLY